MKRTVAAREAEHDWRRADDIDLVEAAPDSRTAVAELYHRHAEQIFRYLLTYSASEEDAADLTQQVFLRALQALPSYRDQGLPFRAWLMKIARNAATDAFRRRRRTVPWEAVPESLQPVGAEDPARLVVRQESLQQLGSLVAGLPADRQELLALRFAAGLSAAEIALVVGASEAATQKRLWRILRTLRERYDDEI